MRVGPDNSALLWSSIQGIRFQCGTLCSDTGTMDRIHANEEILQFEITLRCFDKGYYNCFSKTCPSVPTSPPRS